MADGRMKLCGARYERPGGDERGDRIVRCNRGAGHAPEDHVEIATGNRWPVALPGGSSTEAGPIPEPRSLRVGGSWGTKARQRGAGMVTVVDGPADAAGRHPDDEFVATVVSLPLAEEICDATNTARRARESRRETGGTQSVRRGERS